MNNYPTLKDYYEVYEAAARQEGFTVVPAFAEPLIKDLKLFLDMVYSLGRGDFAP